MSGMKVLVIGQGGREHTIVWKLKQSPRVQQVYCAPGNGGIAGISTIVPYGEKQIEELIEFAKQEKIDVTIIGPEVPLYEGIVDRFEQEGLAAYGPRQNAAIIEGSKSFAKHFMRKYNIPTGHYEVFTSEEEASAYIEEQGAPIVIKADGLAAGKGVVVAHTVQEAKQAVRDNLSAHQFGEASHQVVIEQFLSGEELSLMAFVDGETVLPMVPAQDHKQVYDGDEGPNTGGMGAYSPVPQMTAAQVQQAVERILIPTARGLVQEGRPFTGVLYAGLMMTEEGPMVIEFNARFGDPETQVVLPRLKTDLIDIVTASLEQRLAEIEIEWAETAALTVVAASGGYPGTYAEGEEITGLEQWNDVEDIVVVHAGTVQKGSKLLTAGGRVLSVTALSDDLASAHEKAYAALQTIQFKGMHYRTDIGAKALGQVKQ